MLHGINNQAHGYTRDMFWQEAEALETGPQTTNIKLAVWGALLSADMDLAHNCQAVFALKSEYATTKLPEDRGVVAGLLGAIHGKLARDRYVEALYRAEAQSEQGLFDAFLVFPDDLAGQRAWRDKLAALVFGLGLKTASMVALILFPTRSHLVPCDQHVLKRFGLVDENGEVKTPGSKKAYEQVEDMVLAEGPEVARLCDTKACKGLETHWITWMWRREDTASERNGAMAGEDHLRLNCRRYFVHF